MSNLEFTTRFIPVSCDGCGRPTTAGFWHLHRGTPVLFDCITCAPLIAGPVAVDRALAAHKEIVFRRMEEAR